MKRPSSKKVSLATVDGADVGASVQVITDGELMVNYQSSMPVAPGHRIAAVQDRDGNPMLFSIGSDSLFYLIARDPQSPTGWSQRDLTAGLGAAVAFGVTQRGDGSIYLGLAVASAPGATDSTLYLTAALPGDPADATWASMASHWVARPALLTNDQGSVRDLGAPAVSSILLGENGADGGTIAIVVAAVDGEEQHYFVNGRVAGDRWMWRNYPLPIDAGRVIDLAIGKHSLGAGTYALCRDLSDTYTTLTFTTLPNRYGQTYNRQFTAPPGANALAAIPDPANHAYTQLFVAGDGLSWFPSTGQAANASAVEIVAPGIAIHGLEVRENDAQIAVWWNDGAEDLYYLQGAQTNDPARASWSAPLVLRQQVTQIAAYANRPRETNAIFFVTGGAQLGFMYQDPTSTLWRETDIPLSDTGKIETFNCYTSTFQLLSARGVPLANIPIAVTASEWIYATVNGNLYALDPARPVSVRTDATGTITCINKTSDISTPVYRFRADFLPDSLAVNPADKLIAGFAQIQSADDLKAARRQDGTPVVTADLPDEVYDYGAFCMQQLSTILAQLPADGSDMPPTTTTSFAAISGPQRWGMWFDADGPRLYQGKAVERHLMPRLQLDVGGKVVDFVEGVIGDVLQALEAGFEKVAGFVITAAKNVFELIVKIGAQVIKVVIKAVAQALKVAFWVLDELLGIDLLGFLQWLGFLFDWDDILQTHAVIANVADQVLTALSARLTDTARASMAACAHLRTTLDAMPALPPSVANLTIASVRAQSAQAAVDMGQTDAVQFATGSVGGSFASYQLQYSGMLGGPVAGTTAFAARSEGPIATFFTDILEPAMKTVLGLVPTLIGDIEQIITGFFDGTMTIGQAVRLVLGDALRTLIDVFEIVAKGIASIAGELVGALQAVITYEIELPFLSSFYGWLTDGAPMTLLDGLSLLAAIPSTVFYKLVTNQAPFDASAFGLATGDAQQVFAILTGRSAKAARADVEGDDATQAQIVYSTAGGAAAMLAELTATILDVINVFTREQLQFTDELELIASLVELASTFPVAAEPDTVLVEYSGWALKIMDLLVELCVMMSPRVSREAVSSGIAGPYELLSTTIALALEVADLVIASQDDTGEAQRWDIERFVESVSSAISGYSSALAKIQPASPTLKTIEEAITVAGALGAVALGTIRDVHDMIEGEAFEP